MKCCIAAVVVFCCFVKIIDEFTKKIDELKLINAIINIKNYHLNHQTTNTLQR